MTFWKKVIATSLAANALISLAACGAKKADTDKKATDSKEFSLAVWGYDANPEFKALTEAYKKSHPDVSIKIVDIAADQYDNKVTTMLAGGDQTDVLGIKSVTIGVNWANKGQLENFNDEVNSFSDADMKEGFKGNLDGYKMDGKYFALPFRRDMYVLFYNKAIFDAQGIAYPKDLTWEQYDELAQKLTHEKDGQKVYGAYNHNWASIVQCLAASQTDNDMLKGKYEFMAPYYNRLLKLQKDGYVMNYADIKTANVTYASQFETGKTGMMMMGSFYIGKVLNQLNQGNTKVEWGMTSVPQNKAGEKITFGGPSGFGVNKNGKNVKLAKEFVTWCASKEGAKAVAGIGATPAYQSEEIMDIIFGLKGVPQDEESKAALFPKVNNFEMAANVIDASVGEIVNEEHDLIMVGDITVDKGIDEMNKRVTQAIKDAK